MGGGESTPMDWQYSHRFVGGRGIDGILRGSEEGESTPHELAVWGRGCCMGHAWPMIFQYLLTCIPISPRRPPSQHSLLPLPPPFLVRVCAPAATTPLPPSLASPSGGTATSTRTAQRKRGDEGFNNNGV